MDMALAYRVQMLPAKTRASRSETYYALRKSGWPQELLDREIDSAISWANSHCMTVQQEKFRKTRAAKKTKLKGDDALDQMFRSVGADPNEIPGNRDWQRT